MAPAIASPSGEQSRAAMGTGIPMSASIPRPARRGVVFGFVVSFDLGEVGALVGVPG